MRPKLLKKLRRENVAKARAAKRAKTDLASEHSQSDAATPGSSGNFADIDQKSASQKKLEKMKETIEILDTTEQVWCLAHVRQITRLIGNLSCPNCFEEGLLQVRVCDGENQGFSSKLELFCQKCPFRTTEMTSPRQDDSDRGDRPFEVNTRMTMYSHEIGASHAALKKFEVVMGIPGMHLKTFQRHDKRVTAAEIESGADTLEHTAAAIRKAYAETDLDLQEALDRGETPTVDISVSFDGTWQKRGFTSLYGVGVCIDVLTGLVIDYEIRSKYCHACKIKESQNLSQQELEVWKNKHASECCMNHTLSSKAMESEAAKVMWGRSIQKYNFRYVEMLSDGDSTAYAAVQDMAPYGNVEVRKLECVNHAHKRMGTALRKLSKEQQLGGCGVGRLTDKKCDDLQNYYREAVINNLDSVEKMRAAVWATFYHSISTDEQHFHYRCPEGPESWCFYQRAVAVGEDPPRHTDHPAHTFLSQEVAEKLVPVYERMSNESLLQRMLHGRTQNCNECLNSQIWLRCPKTVFMGKGRVEAAVARAVGVFNQGRTELVRVMNKLWVEVSMCALENLNRADDKRVSKANAATTLQARGRRKQHALQRRLQVRAEQSRDGEVYGAGIGK